MTFRDKESTSAAEKVLVILLIFPPLTSSVGAHHCTHCLSTYLSSFPHFFSRWVSCSGRKVLPRQEPCSASMVSPQLSQFSKQSVIYLSDQPGNTWRFLYLYRTLPSFFPPMSKLLSALTLLTPLSGHEGFFISQSHAGGWEAPLETEGDTDSTVVLSNDKGIPAQLQLIVFPTQF